MDTVYWNDKFRQWAQAPSQTEREKAERAERMVRAAIQAYASLATRNISVFAQGSYRNRTNVRGDSDVDICVLSRAAFIPDYSLVPGVTDATLGSRDADYQLPHLKRDVEAALRAHFGKDTIKPGDKAFDVKENTSRISADVVLAFEGRLYYRDTYGLLGFHSGTVLQSASTGGLIFNWPEQHYTNGVKKHDDTGQQFKKKARCLKSLRYEMMDNDVASAKAVSSFLLESLVYNCPKETFEHPSHLEDMKAMILHLWAATENVACEASLVEVNDIKFLFHATQAWNRAATRTFLQDVWNYVEFGT